jgi:hypothetical protein
MIAASTTIGSVVMLLLCSLMVDAANPGALSLTTLNWGDVRLPFARMLPIVAHYCALLCLQKPDSVLIIDPSNGSFRSLMKPFEASQYSVDASAHDDTNNMLYIAIGRPPELQYSLATLNMTNGRIIRNVTTGLPGMK